MLIDIHGHPPRTEAERSGYLDALARWDARLLVSHLGPRARGWLHEPEVDEWRLGNHECAEFVRAHPDVLAGYVYVNPAHTREALDEMERRLLGQRETFVALKLWVAVRCSDLRLDPIMEFCAAHEVPVLQHTWMKVGPGGPGSGNLPGESTPLDLLALARRHPRVKFFGGHTGGDWEWGVDALKQVDNVWLDVAGGEASGAYAEIALRAVGAGRIVYGTDVPGRSVPSQLAKILCLDVSSDDLDRMLWKNAAAILGARLPAAWRITAPASTVRPEPIEGRSAPITLTTQPDPVRTPLIDSNAFLGEWPSRRLDGSPPGAPGDALERRLQDMDRHGIERAIVSPLAAVWLKNTGVANRELDDLLRQRRDGRERLFPAYVLNPTWPAADEHLDRVLTDYTLAAAIRLLPGYHVYRLDDPAVDRCLLRLAQVDLPVILTVQLEDSRMHHPAMRVPDVPLESIAAAVARHPAIKWLVAGCVQSQVVSLARQLPSDARVWFDVSRVQGPIDCFRLLRDAPGVGVRRLLFGTNLPLHVPESPLMELADARFTPDEEAAVCRGNALDLFGPLRR